MKIIAASIIKNVAPFIESMINSISWVDKIILYNDHSTDKTGEIVSNLSNRTNGPEINLIKPLFRRSMISYLPDGSRDLQYEMKIRNTFIEYIFSNFDLDALVLIDGDELMSKNFKVFIEKIIKDPLHDSIAITCNHILDKKTYLHIYETTWNNVFMVDPHVRVLTKLQKYQRGEYKDVPDCFIKPSPRTLCLDGAYHYHLKYIKDLKQRNYALRFLPKYLDNLSIKKYSQKNRYSFPSDLKELINNYCN